MRRAIKILSLVVLIAVGWFAAKYFLNYQSYEVKAESTPVSGAHSVSGSSWISTWGGEDFFSGCGNCGAWYDTCNDVVVDDAGFIYVTGRTREQAYPDPDGSCYLTKFDLDGNVIWRHRWAGGAGMGQALVYDPAGSVVLAGTFSSKADLDPGPDYEGFESVEGNDLFLIKFNLDGEYQWAVTWGGHDGADALHQDSITALARDSGGNLYAVGGWYGACDFDPYAGIALHTSVTIEDEYSTYPISTIDIYLTSFTSDGRFRWVRTWPSESYRPIVTDIVTDDEDNLYITGGIDKEVDMDPGSGRHIVRPIGDDDAYLLQLDSDGQFNWVRLWGGSQRDIANGVSVRDGLVYVVGEFGAEAQFDPGPDTLFLTANDQKDAFLSIFDTDGILQWAKSWGGDDNDTYWETDSAKAVRIAEDGTICIAGLFTDSLGYPGNAGESVDAKGTVDSYILFLDPDDGLENVIPWGKSGSTTVTSFAFDHEGNIYAVGNYNEAFEIAVDGVDYSAGQVATLGEYSYASSDSFLIKIGIDQLY